VIADHSKYLTTALVVLVAALLLLQAWREANPEMVRVGEPAPRLQAPKLGGGQLDLEELKGKAVMLDFWATWCGPCQQEMPSLIKLAREYREKGLVFVAADRIETDHQAAVGAYLDRLEPQRPDNMIVVFADEPTLDRFKVQALPTLYLISAEGRVVDAFRGLTSEDVIREAVEKALRP
jgi:thiol-disulfide isomerase/thioredoxin